MKPYRLFFLACLVIGAACCATAAETWLTDYEAAKAQALRENKKLLLDFTGSDWCGFCIKLENEVLTTAEFAAFAKDLVLVRLDYPKKKLQTAVEKEQNAKLKEQFKIEGYPTLIVVDATGVEASRAVGYAPGSGPDAYLAQFKK